MAFRYTPEELIFLRESPLVVKPPALPPSEQWMGYDNFHLGGTCVC